MAEDLEDRILQRLSFDEPMTERDLYDSFQDSPETIDEVAHATNVLLSRNKIRWVAFQGFCRGGRPV